MRENTDQEKFRIWTHFTQSGATLLQSETDITKLGTYYKVGQYIDQSYIKKLVRKIYCPQPFLSFA